MNFFGIKSLEEKVEDLKNQIDEIDGQLVLRGQRLQQEADEHAALRRKFDSLVGY